MTANEFKAWFEGFAEAVGEVPTPEQWKRIREQVKAIAPDRGCTELRRGTIWGRAASFDTALSENASFDVSGIKVSRADGFPPEGAVWLAGGSPLDRAADAKLQEDLGRAFGHRVTSQIDAHAWRASV